MTSGQNHYTKAEKILGGALDLYAEGNAEGGRFAVAVAQVHATLALVAATALSDVNRRSYGDGEAWVDTLAAAEPVAAQEVTVDEARRILGGSQ
jgi:hypothetical protein